MSENQWKAQRVLSALRGYVNQFLAYLRDFVGIDDFESDEEVDGPSTAKSARETINFSEDETEPDEMEEFGDLTPRGSWGALRNEFDKKLAKDKKNLSDTNEFSVDTDPGSESSSFRLADDEAETTVAEEQAEDQAEDQDHN